MQFLFCALFWFCFAFCCVCLFFVYFLVAGGFVLARSSIFVALSWQASGVSKLSGEAFSAFQVVNSY